MDTHTAEHLDKGRIIMVDNLHKLRIGKDTMFPFCQRSLSFMNCASLRHLRTLGHCLAPQKSCIFRSPL